MSKGVFIGIDPGVQTGVCVWDADLKQIIQLMTLTFWPLIGMLNESQKNYGKRLFVVVEDPNLNKSMHWQQKKSVHGFDSATKVAQNVGMNKKEASLIIEFLKRNEFNYRAIKPTSRKVRADYFKHLTGYTKRTNQHERDAGMLVIGN